MMRYKKIAALTVVAALILGLVACRAVGESETAGSTVNGAAPTDPHREPEEATTQPETTEPEPTVTVPFEPVEVEPSIPLAPIETEPVRPGTEGETVEDMQVIRTQDVAQSVLESLIARNPREEGLPLLQLEDLDALQQLLDSVGSETLSSAAEQYGEDFFRGYDLIVIPRVTNTGSVRHTASASVQDGVYLVELSVTVPEITTMDMANWFLLIPAPKADTQGRTVQVAIAGNFGPIELNPMPTTGFVFN